mmetsp:Transcript_16444/g.40670  ORF Transcript_16444/g.40670 Transcript_16444/m.40670 type:complete len:394 (-) Transcript_16444:328-1509(-)
MRPVETRARTGGVCAKCRVVVHHDFQFALAPRRVCFVRTRKGGPEPVIAVVRWWPLLFRNHLAGAPPGAPPIIDLHLCRRHYPSLLLLLRRSAPAGGGAADLVATSSPSSNFIEARRPILIASATPTPTCGSRTTQQLVVFIPRGAPAGSDPHGACGQPLREPVNLFRGEAHRLQKLRRGQLPNLPPPQFLHRHGVLDHLFAEFPKGQIAAGLLRRVRHDQVHRGAAAAGGRVVVGGSSCAGVPDADRRFHVLVVRAVADVRLNHVAVVLQRLLQLPAAVHPVRPFDFGWLFKVEKPSQPHWTASVARRHRRCLWGEVVVRRIKKAPLCLQVQVLLSSSRKPVAASRARARMSVESPSQLKCPTASAAPSTWYVCPQEQRSQHIIHMITCIFQ